MFHLQTVSFFRETPLIPDGPLVGLLYAFSKSWSLETALQLLDGYFTTNRPVVNDEYIEGNVSFKATQSW